METQHKIEDKQAMAKLSTYDTITPATHVSNRSAKRFKCDLTHTIAADALSIYRPVVEMHWTPS